MAIDSVTMRTEQGETTMTAEQFHEAVDRLTGMRIPSEARFGEGDFLEAPDIEQVARRLINKDLRFRHLGGMSLAYLWKKTGGKRSGKGVYGKCQKPSGLLKHFAEVDFVIWLAADHCRDANYGGRQLEALLFHELLHCGYDEDEETGERKPATRAHDFEGFRAELEAYGLWDDDFRGLARTVKQLGLFIEADGQA